MEQISQGRQEFTSNTKQEMLNQIEKFIDEHNENSKDFIILYP